MPDVKPELKSITIKGFKSIASIENLELRPINLIIGANGSGKSNFIEVFSLVRAIHSGWLDEYVTKARGAQRLLHFGSKVTDQILIALKYDFGSYSAELLFVSVDDLWLKHEDYRVGNDPPIGQEGSSISDLHQLVWAKERDRFSHFVDYHFHDTGPTSPLKRTAEINDNRDLRQDGSNLAAFLYFLRLKHPDSYSLIRRTVQRVAPFFDDFQLEPLRLNDQTIQLEWRHVGSDAYFDASSLSDGTLRFMALATLFLQPEELRPSVILVDEPELGLHPYAITLLASLVKQASVTSQVILSTQSPSLLDHFEPEDVLVADRVNGSTQLRRLESEPLAQWLEDYSLGQLWEKNELGGRPSGE